MPTIPTKLYEAFEKIRLGKVEEGTRLFDRMDGFDVIKAIPLAELCWFRHDWKRGMLFAQDFFMDDFKMWSGPSRISYYGRYLYSYAEQHIQLYILATCVLDCWKESRVFLEEFKKRDQAIPAELRKHCNIPKAISMVADPENTKRSFLDAQPKPRMEGTIDLEYLERKAKNAAQTGGKSRKNNRRWTYDGLMEHAYSKASTEDHYTLYEQYANRLEEPQAHQEAAKSCIALENLQEAKEAIRRFMRCWEFREPYQVAPIELFTDPELWPIMSDRRFTESLLTISHHRES